MLYPSGVLTRFCAIRPAQGSAGSFNQKELPVAASQTINLYDIVSLSSGNVQQSIATPAAGTFTLSGGNLPTLGIALAPIVTPASGGELVTGRTTIPVAILDGNLEIALRIYNATASNTQINDLTLGTAYQFGHWTQVTYTNPAGASATSVGDGYAISTTTTNGELKFVQASANNEGTTANYQIGWFRPIVSDTVRQG